MNHQVNKLVDAYNKGAAKAQVLSGLGTAVAGMCSDPVSNMAEIPYLANYREQSVFGMLARIELLFESFDNTLHQLEQSLSPVSFNAEAVPPPVDKTSEPASPVPMVQRLVKIHDNMCTIGRRLEDINSRIMIA